MRRSISREASRPGSRPSLNAGQAAVWSPDGQRIAYYAFPPVALLERAANGAGQQETILQAPQGVYVGDWSPDGHTLLYEEVGSDNRTNLWLFPRAASASDQRKPAPYLKAPSNQSNAQFSPDGKWISYTSDESGHQEIFVQSFPQGDAKWQVSNSGGNYARWRRDGKELFYRALDGKLMAVPVRATAHGLEFGASAPLFRIIEPLGLHSYPYDVAPDGRILALVPANENEASLTILINWQAALKR